MIEARPFGWLGILRLGLAQAALGAIVVLTTSTLNRVMIVELALPAALPGALVALHYALQMLRPRMGHGSDVGGRRTPWIIGGIAVLAIGGVAAAGATALMATHLAAGIMLGVAAFVLIGLGAGAGGTSLLVLLAVRVPPARKAAAASIVWLMMIAGFAITAGTAGHFLDPFSETRLLTVTSVVCVAAVLLASVAVWGVEGEMAAASPAAASHLSFRAALAQVWAEPQARRFTLFVFVSMLAYNAQELILEPFAGAVFHLTPGGSTSLAGVQHGGALLGMILVGVTGTLLGGGRPAVLRAWAIAGCIASAAALLGLVAAAWVGPAWPLHLGYFLLGAANGVFAAAAVSLMMAQAGDGHGGRDGVRMGIWGAAQAVAFGLGGLAGTVAADLGRVLLGGIAPGYAAVFASEAVLFLIAGWMGARLGRPFAARPTRRPQAAAPGLLSTTR
jgi:BCD family chlorophyll transporter-like MFS transporter